MRAYSLFCLGPLGELQGLAELHDSVLEKFDLGCAGTLHIKDEGVHQALGVLGGEVGPEDGPLDRVVRAVGVGAHSAGLNRLVLSV